MDLPLPDDLLIRDDDDLTDAWERLMGDLVFGERILWMLVLSCDGAVAGPLLQVADLPDGPYDVPVEELVGFVRDLLEGPGEAASVAFLLTRPGTGPWHLGDRAWTRYLQIAAAVVGDRIWAVHRAHDGLLEVCPVA
ncbi:hypothetical protein [Marmoricola sp. RAF53]|uniref:hypothetical protein n=1 Tax=Marmoricola sp. RAF53 TaxID=3233059 RepID=UPI003F9DB94F